MISRRHFLQVGTVATGATLAARSIHASAEEKCTPLPASIASLKPMKEQAKPIAREERRERQEKARRLMQANHLDAILLTEGTSLTYFTGVHWGGGERADVRIWQEDESPYHRVAQGLKDREIATGMLGMEETTRFVFSDGIAKAAPQVKIVPATPVTAGCRMIKSSHEIELMRLAAKVTLTAYEAAYRALKEGVTQAQFADLIEAAHTALGFSGGADVQVGEYSAFPHGSITPQVIREGTIALMDGGCKVEGYSSDITRTFVLGKPSDKMKKVFDIVHHAQTVALKTARPGLECQAVDAAARKVIADAGYGPDYKFFTHRLGHGMGMDGHEWPYLVRANTTLLARGMTFSDEPGIYIPGEFGVRLEDDMHITESGAELFTPQSPSLEDPFRLA